MTESSPLAAQRTAQLGGQQEVRGGLVGWQSGHFRRAAQDCQQAKLQVARPRSRSATP